MLGVWGSNFDHDVTFAVGEVAFREGVNREKLTVKKISKKEIFFSPFMSLTNREKNRHKP